MDIKIRPALESDSLTIANFQIQMAWETEEYALDRDTVTRGVTAVFANKARGAYFVAEVNAKVIACLLTTYEWSDWRNGTVWWIQSVYVLPEFRTKGVFRLLYSYVKSIVQNNSSLKGLRLYVDRRNNVAQNVYNQIGMDGGHYQVFEWMKE